jgi:ADP-ribosylglycohydrolase/protein-tyrosine phosphatase
MSHDQPPFANSYWVSPGLLLAGPYPGDVEPAAREHKLAALALAGVKHVVNLQPSDEVGRSDAKFPDLASELARLGISMVRAPVQDMDVPTSDVMRSVLDEIDLAITSGKCVYLHCWGGHGRTGTVVGCWLRRHGLETADGTLNRIKSLRTVVGIQPPSPQTEAQRRMVKSWPSPDAIPRSNRLAGAVWGALVGDAIGVPYEFGSPVDASEVRWGRKGTHNQPPGTWSDDGGLLLALLDSVVTVGWDPEDQARRAVAWYDGPDYKPGPRFDVGIATQAALARFKSGVAAVLAGGTEERDNGNGSLMRILPVALVSGSDPAEIVGRAEAASSVTHRHPRSRLTCGLYCLLVAEFIAGEMDRDAAYKRAKEHLLDLRSATDSKEIDVILSHGRTAGSGYVVDSFHSAWSAFVRSSSYAEAIKSAVAFGDDTDTTACVAGGLAGSYWGLSGIPGEWLTQMRGRQLVEPLVAKLVTSAATKDG